MGCIFLGLLIITLIVTLVQWILLIIMLSCNDIDSKKDFWGLIIPFKWLVNKYKELE